MARSRWESCMDFEVVGIAYFSYGYRKMSIFFVDLRYNGRTLANGGSPLAQRFDFVGGNAMNSSVPIQPPIFFKNPTVATILSLVISGLGQLYNGQIFKGIFFFGSMVVSFWLMSPLTLFVGFILAP